MSYVKLSLKTLIGFPILGLVLIIGIPKEGKTFFPPPSCSAADKASAGAWAGNTSCASPAVSLSNTCTFESPDPTGYPQISTECDDFIAMTAQPDLDRCHQATVCGTFTAECDHMTMFQMATYSTCAGWVESASEVLYNASCTPIQSTSTIGGGPWTSLTPGDTYIYCLSFQMLNCNIQNAYLYGVHMPIPTADFSSNTACEGSATNFTNQGTTGGGTTFSWDFDGLGSSTLENPSYTFPSDGSYAVTLETCQSGCCDQKTINVSVNPNPTASFTVSSANPQCLVGNFFSFTNTGTTGGATTYSWDYGDGSSSTGQNGSHSYASDGSFNVCLTTTLNGCTDQSCTMITVNPAPSLSTVVTNESCIGMNDGAIDLSVNGGPCGSCTFSWIDDSANPISVAEDPTGLAAPVTYTVTVTDPNTCTAVTAALVDTTGPCVCGLTTGFTINSNPQCLETNSFSFTNTGTSHGGIITVEWDFEDDGTYDATGNAAGNVYSASGAVTVRQRITDTSVPCSQFSTQVITINQATANAGSDLEICQGESVSLSGSGGTSYSWRQIQGSGTLSNSGTSAPTVTPSGSFPATNEYEVTVTDANSCTDLDSVIVSFNNLTVDAGPDKTGCRNANINLNGLYTNASVAFALGSPTTLSYIGSPDAVPNNDANGHSMNINYTVANTYLQEVCMDITIGSANELKIVLENPCGTQIVLSDHNGTDAAADYDGTCFDDASATPINSVGPNAPFPSTYSPENPLSNLDLCPSSGNWTLTVIDDVNQTLATTYTADVNSWHITFAEEDPDPEPAQSWSNSLYLNRTDTDTVVFNASVQGEYRKYFTVTDDNCSQMDSVDILVCDCNLSIDSAIIKVGPVWGNTWIFDMREPFDCATVDPTDFDIVIAGGSGALCSGSFSIVSATPVGCSTDNFTGLDTSSQIQISISPNLPNECHLRIIPSATNNIVDRCGFLQRSDPGIILPIEWLALTASSVGEAVRLEWETASEAENDRFVVERSSTGLDFDPIGNVKGSGFSSTPKAYAFIDKFPIDGLGFYRIQQVDHSGDFSYSNIISIDHQWTGIGFQLLSVNPVPAKDYLYVHYSSGNTDPVSLVLYDMLGRQAYSRQFNKTHNGINKVSIDLTHLPESGMYSMVLSQGTDQYQDKIVKY